MWEIELASRIVDDQSRIASGSLLEQANFRQSNFDLHALNSPSPLTNFRTSLNIRTPLFDQRQSRTRIAQAELQQQQIDTASNQAQQIFDTNSSVFIVRFQNSGN